MHWILQSLLTASGTLLFFGIVFLPLERLFPARRGQAIIRPGWWTDLCFFCGQYLLWAAMVTGLVSQIGWWLDAHVPGGLRATVAGLPWWGQALGVVVLSDFAIYWAHRLQHRVPFLWRFHSVHHSAEHLDWLAAHREHPIDTIYTLTAVNLPAFVVGFPLETIAGFLTFRGLWAIYIHSNIRMPIGPIRVLIGAPELHHWHHHRDRDAGNYANLSPLMDVIFGTYRCPDHEPDALGVAEPFPSSYFGQLLHPFRRRPRI